MSNSIDQAFKVVRDAAGDIVVTGTTDDGTGPRVLIIKYSGTDGTLLWQTSYYGGSYSGGPAAAVALDGPQCRSRLGCRRLSRRDLARLR